jgi:hypothetical protein
MHLFLYLPYYFIFYIISISILSLFSAVAIEPSSNNKKYGSDGVGVGVWVGVSVLVGVLVGVTVLVAVLVGVTVGVLVGVTVLAAVLVGV